MPNLVEVTYEQTGKLNDSVGIEYLAKEIYERLSLNKDIYESIKI